MKYPIYFVSLLAVLAGCTPSNVKTKARTGSSAGATSSRSSDPFLFALRSRFLDNGDQVRVYVSVEPERELTPEAFAQEFTVRTSLLPDYNSRQELLPARAVKLTEGENFLKKGQSFILWYDLPKPAADKQIYTGVAMTEITDTKGGTAVNDTPIRFQSGKVSDYFAFFDAAGKVPVLTNFARQGDTLQLKGLSRADTAFKSFHYGFDFDPALPPMATMRPQPKQLYVDSMARVTTGKPFVVGKEGLHYFVRDTTETYGIGLVGVPDRYPRYTFPQQLNRPLVYMSTNQEINDVRNGNEPKRALDRYWLAMSNGNQQTAKRTISAFYRRVEQANKLFTGYKEGWKTDRGMVYIIMGPPNRVNRSKDREVWVYNKRNSQFSEINFTFNKRSNQFVEDHYELSRFVEFQPIWYPAVEAWRNGEIE